MKLPEKSNDLIRRIRRCLEVGRYRYTEHALQRMRDRGVIHTEVKRVLKAGYHEKRKDKFNEKEDEWNYSIRGKTIDARTLRVIISFTSSNLLIITVINLDKKS